jgi:hypothetical protein
LDGQVWTEADGTLPIVPSLSATALGVVRDGEGLPNPALAGGGVTLDARSGSWTFTAGDLWVCRSTVAWSPFCPAADDSSVKRRMSSGLRTGVRV